MENKTFRIEFRKELENGNEVEWPSTATFDGFEEGIYKLNVYNDDNSHGLPFRLADDEPLTLIVKYYPEDAEAKLQRERKIVQTLTYVQRSTGKVFTCTRTRRYNGKDYVWSNWEELEAIVQVGYVNSFDSFTNNGIFKGTYSTDDYSESFVINVINNSAVAVAAGSEPSVSQFKYALDSNGAYSYKTRVRTKNGDIFTWGSWVDLGATKTDDIQPGAITAEKLHRNLLEQIVRTGADASKSANAAYWTTARDAVTLNINKNDDTVEFQTLPSATNETAGVMSAEDKKSVGIDIVKVKQLFKSTYIDIDFSLNPAIQYVGVLVEAENGIDGFRVVGLADDENVEYVAKEDSTVGKWLFFKLTKQHDKLRVIFSGSYIKEDTNATITVKECNNLSLVVAESRTAIKKIEEAAAEQEAAVNKNKMDIAENKVVINGLGERIYKQGDTLVNTTATIKSGTTLTKDTTLVTEVGEYVIKVENISADVSSFRLVGYKVAGGSITLLAHKQVLGKDIPFQLSEPMTKLRVVIEPTYVTEAGDISVVIRTPSYDIQEDLSVVKENVEKNTQDIESLKSQTNVVDIMFPVPNDIYCAVGTDMNLYYENMFGMLLGSGYMFIDSPNVVYETSADDSGGYDKPLNLERQFHFKPNEAGTMELYLNVWNDYMQQVAAKSTLLHIVNPVAASGKTVNMLVNGSSSIDMGFMQAEIKLLLEAAGATVNMVGRWASGYMDDPREDVRYDVPNRLSENRSGGDSSLYTTKANSGKTVIVHPTNLTEQFYQYDAVLQDDAGNTWDVWGNSADFCELVLKSGDISTIPASGTLAKISGKGLESFTYDRLITDVPQTTNPFWSDTLNGISFTEYCSNWNRPTPNVFVTLWGTNDIKGSGGNIETGKQWATDAQIKTFVERQKILVDAFTRDCPEGVVIMCPQPTGSSLTGKKNSDRNGMLYSKLKATQALMDAFAGYDNVIIVPVLWWFDRRYSYTAKDVTISERMAEYYGDKYLDVVTDDSTHPDARGYYQMADAAYSAIVYWLDKKMA